MCVCGATATGKTDLAFELARRLETEIISFDSVQVYKYFDIGSAKPSREMLSEIRHHLVDAIEPEIGFTAGDFRKSALAIINNLKHKLNTFVLVGGTGFYLQALLKGMFGVPEVSPALKKELEIEAATKGLVDLYIELKKRDPAYASKIHSNDSYRILRGLELMRSGDKTVTAIQKEFSAMPSPFDVCHVGLRREKERLVEAIKKRTTRMLDEGLIEETKKLLEKYPAARFPDGIRPLESVGYQETVSFLKGEIRREALTHEISRNTAALAKRQNTWFKREKNMYWFDPDQVAVTVIANEVINSISKVK